MNAINRTNKVLIMTIGTGASGADIAHGLFFSIKDSNPNLLILIGSSKSFETTLPHLKNLITHGDLQLELLEKIIEEVNDLESLHFQYSKIITDLLNLGYSLNKICVDYTSGTKAMSAALVSAAIENKVGSLSYVYGDRGEGGRVKSGTERKSTLSPNKLYSKSLFQKSIEAFNNFRFTASIEILSEQELHPEYQSRATILGILARMFDAWDRFDFDSSFSIAKSIRLEDLKDFNLKGKFESIYIPSLIKLKTKNISLEKLFDLISNAKRRASEGKYDDAVARLYRSLEMLGQIEFEELFNCPTSDVILQKMPVLVREEIESKFRDLKDGKIKIPLYGVFTILAEVKNESGLLFVENLDQIKYILTLRNNSILAHGAQPLNHANFETALNILNSLTSIKSSRLILSDFPKLSHSL